MSKAQSSHCPGHQEGQWEQLSFVASQHCLASFWKETNIKMSPDLDLLFEDTFLPEQILKLWYIIYPQLTNTANGRKRSDIKCSMKPASVQCIMVYVIYSHCLCHSHCLIVALDLSCVNSFNKLLCVLSFFEEVKPWKGFCMIVWGQLFLVLAVRQLAWATIEWWYY